MEQVKTIKNKILNNDDNSEEDDDDLYCEEDENIQYEEYDNQTYEIVQKALLDYTEYLPLCEYLYIRSIKQFVNRIQK